VTDRLSGTIEGKRVLLSVRSLPGTAVTVKGLRHSSSVIGWGSDGKQDIELYEAVASGTLSYEIEIKPRRSNDRPPPEGPD
jgi:hypothetical protein